MKRFFSILLVLLVCAGGYATQRLIPANQTFEGNVAFITVGNTNHYLKGATDRDTLVPRANTGDRTKENGRIAPIVNAADDAMFSGVTVNNANFSKFIIDLPRGVTCPDNIRIRYATLTWGGRSYEPERSNVRILITTWAGDLIPGVSDLSVNADETSDVELMRVNRGIYACHADITPYVENAVNSATGETQFRFYVANINTLETDAVTPPIGQFSGWTLTIVYEHNGLPERRILIYRPDVLPDVSGTGGVEDGIEKQSLNCMLDYGAGTVLPDFDISFVSTFLGAYRSGYQDQIFGNADNRDGEELATMGASVLYHRMSNSSTTTVSNVLSNSTYFRYEYAKTDEDPTYKVDSRTDGYIQSYTRGFDLNTEVGKFEHCLDKEAGRFNVAGNLVDELQFFTDAVLMFGQPDIPGVILRDKVPEADVEPGKQFRYSMFVGLHQNTENPQEMVLRIPLSEYVDKIDDIKIKVSDKVSDANFIGPLSMHLKWGSRDYTVVSSLSKNWKNNRSWSLKEDRGGATTVASLNNELFVTDTLNRNVFFNNPANIQDRVLEITFEELRAIGVNADEAIEIELTLVSKPDKDWAYLKNILLDEPLPFLQNSELTFNTPTGRKSVLESVDKKEKDVKWDDYLCKQKTRTPLCEGNVPCGCIEPPCIPIPDCPTPPCIPEEVKKPCENSSYDKDMVASAKGVFTKDTTHVSISVGVKEKLCPYEYMPDYHVQLPDSIVIPFCDGEVVTPQRIKDHLLDVYHINLDSLAHLDSMVMLDAKRAAILDYMKRYGASRKQMEGLIRFDDVSATKNAIATAEAIKAEFPCFSDDENVFDHDIDSIMNMKIKYTDIFLMYKTDRDGDFYESKADSVALRELTSTKTWTFTEDADLFLKFYSPWSEERCSKFIPLKVRSFKQDPPVVKYAGRVLEEGELIRLCFGSTLDTFHVFKQEASYDIYASYAAGAEYETVNVDPVMDFNWYLPDDKFSTSNAGLYEFSVISHGLSCRSKPFNFQISVSEHPITDVPVIDTVQGNKFLKNMEIIDLCKSLDSRDSLELKLYKPLDGYTPLWYMQTFGANPETKKIAEGVNSIKVLKDSISTIYYSVVYSNQDCVGDRGDTASVEIHPLPDTLKPDTFGVCYDYDLKEIDLIGKVKAKQAGIVVEYFNDINDANSSSTASKLEDVIAALNTSKTAGYTPYYVRAKFTETGCQSVPTTNQLQRYNYTKLIEASDASSSYFPIVNGTPIDSALICLGAEPLEDLNGYLGVQEYAHAASDNVKWLWKHKTPGVPFTPPEYSPTMVMYDTISTPRPWLKGNKVGHDTLYVMRVDSNNCISEPAQFRMHVDSNITSVPLVDDSLLRRDGLEYLPLHYCQNEPKYKSAYIPAWGSEPGYVVEWYKTDSVKQYVKDTVVTIPYAPISFEEPDTLYYVVRQSTALGCHGKWLPVMAMIHPAVTAIPEIDPIERCLNEVPVVVNSDSVKNKPVGEGLYTSFLYKGAENTTGNYKTSVTIPTDSAGRFDTATVFFTNPLTECKSKAVPVISVIHDLPHLPVVQDDTVQMCRGKEGDVVNLADISNTTVNPLDDDTYLYWEKDHTEVPNGTISVSDSKRDQVYTVVQKNSETGCVGEKVEVLIRIDSTFSYTHVDTILCYGATLPIYDVVKAHTKKKSAAAEIISPTLDWKIYPLNGTTPNLSPLAENADVKSQKPRNENHEMRFLVNIEDQVAGCSVQDTMKVLFKGLPKIKAFADIDTCSAAEFVLPLVAKTSPQDTAWYRANNTLIAGSKMNLTESEKLYVVVADEYACKDTAYLNVKIRTNPAKPQIIDDKICQNSGEYVLKISKVGSTDNDADYLSLIVKDMAGNVVADNKINTDTIEMGGSTQKSLKYAVYQQHNLTTCFSTDTITLTVNRMYTPNMPDIGITNECFDAEVDFVSEVKQYVSTNSSAIGFSDTTELKYAFFDKNGEISEEAARNITRGTVDTATYYYTISDKNDICKAKDTILIVQSKRPSAPSIENDLDSLFICKDGSEIVLHAKTTDEDMPNLAIFWDGATTYSDTLLLKAESRIVTAIVKDTMTNCESPVSQIVVKMVDNVAKVEKDPITLCSGVEIDLFELLKNNLTYTPVYRSDVVYTAKNKAGFVDTEDLKKLSMTVLTEDVYELELKDNYTGCVASTKQEIKWVDPLSNKINAKLQVCQGDDLEFSEMGEESAHAVEWYVGGNKISTAPSYSLKNLTQDTVITLVSKLSLEGSQCVDTVLHKVKVNATPDQLAQPDSFFFCQADANDKIVISHDAYKLEWTDEEQSVVAKEQYEIALNNPVVRNFDVRLINKVNDTITCRSLPVKVTAEVVAHIDVTLQDSVVCLPNTYPLWTEIQRDDLEVVSISPKPADSSAVNVTADYKVVYNDRHKCETSAMARLKFIKKPDIVELPDTFNMCLGIETLLRPTKKGDNCTISWRVNNVDTLYSDTLHIVAQAESEQQQYAYDVYRIDTLYGCMSEVSKLVYNVFAPIHINTVENQHICDYEEIDLDSLGTTLFDYSEKLDIKYSESKNHISYIAKSPVSTCEATAELDIIKHERPQFTVTGNEESCAMDTVNLVAKGDYDYVWNNKRVGNTLDVTSKVAVDTMITVEASLKEAIAPNKYCYSYDTLIVRFNFVPTLIGGKLDTIYCQDVEEDALTLTPTHADASIEWFSYEDNYVKAHENNDLYPSTKVAGDFVYKFRQTLGICSTDLQNYSVNVRPRIEVSLQDTNICSPATYNLWKEIQKQGLRVTSIDPRPADSSAVDVKKTYHISYVDSFGCTATASTFVMFVPKPDTVDVPKEFNMCLGSELVIRPMESKGNNRTIWENETSSIVSDTLKIKAELQAHEPKTFTYDVYRKDTVYGCKSDVAKLIYTVYDSIHPNTAVNQHLCDYDVIDLDSLGKTLFDHPEKLEISYTEKDNHILYSANDPISTCKASSELDIIRHKLPSMKVSGNHDACMGDVVTLVAEGDYDFLWNTTKVGEKLNVTSPVAKDTTIKFTAKLKEAIADGKFCPVDSMIKVKFHFVPDTIETTIDTLCQGTSAEALSLNTTHDDATVVWYSFEDGYEKEFSTVYPNTTNDGVITYKFKQTLGICSTKLQEYPVYIQPRIKELPELRDTMYCINSDPKLLSEYVLPTYQGYKIEWLDLKGNEVDASSLPSTNSAGITAYYARYAKDACKGEKSEMKVEVVLHYEDKPLGEILQRFCPNTGNQPLVASTNNDAARLNWYADYSSTRLSNVDINTDNPSFKTATYKVTQSVLDDCESEPLVINVELKEPVSKLDTLRKNMCLGEHFSAQELFLEREITDTIDKVQNELGAELTSSISNDGLYYVDVHNNEMCYGTHVIKVKNWSIGKSSYLTPRALYCIGDEVSLAVSTANPADYKWYSVNTGEIMSYTADLRYNAPVESDSVLLVMSVKDMPRCSTEVKFAVAVAPRVEFDIIGDTLVCEGNSVNLSASHITNNVWRIGEDSTKSESFLFTPKKSEFVTVTGLDEYQCKASKTVLVRMYEKPTVSFAVRDMVEHPKYQLSRDDRNLTFDAIVVGDESASMNYVWDMGDGNSQEGETVDYEYEYDFVNLIKPILVKLRVAYDFDNLCYGTASKVLYVDPDFKVPNSMTTGDHFMPKYNVQIFDRVGNFIFEGSNGWEGQDMKGKPVFGDTYFYAITYFIDGKKHVKNGYITVVR